MRHKINVEVVEDGFKAFFKKTHERARALDRGEKIPSETTVYFESAADMFRMLTTQRVRLMQELRETGPVSITILADSLGRNKRAVSRDVSSMREAGVLKTEYAANAGHGRRLIVKPIAKRVELKTYL